MKILVISYLYPSKHNHWFGIFVKNQVAELKRQGIARVILIANSNDKKDFGNFILKTFILLLRVFFATLFAKFDIVHCYYAFPTGSIALIPKFLRRKKVVLTVIGGDVLKEQLGYGDWFYWLKLENVRRGLAQLALDKADRIITMSNDLSYSIRNDYNIDLEKMNAINMGVDRNLFLPRRKQEVRSKLNIDQEKIVILFTGRLIENKGPHYLIEALPFLDRTLLKRLCCYFVGEGDVKRFKALAMQYRVLDNIIFMKAVPQAQVNLWMSAADIFVFPTLTETFGLVALEAMASGTPVIASHVGGIGELIQDGSNGFLVKPRSPHDICRKIDILLKDKALCAKIVSNGIETAKKHDIVKQVGKILDIYRFLLEKD